jgi:general secretion pathway protein G
MDYLTKKQDAFTIMEVMIAVIVIGILATFAIPNVMRMWKKIKVNTTMGVMATIETALHDYREDIGHFPRRKEGGLDALVQKPQGQGMEKWDGPYIKGKTEMPLDAWNQPFELNLPPDIVKKDKHKYYEIVSHGPNGPDDETDNIYIGG